MPIYEARDIKYPRWRDKTSFGPKSGNVDAALQNHGIAHMQKARVFYTSRKKINYAFQRALNPNWPVKKMLLFIELDNAFAVHFQSSLSL